MSQARAISQPTGGGEAVDGGDDRLAAGEVDEAAEAALLGGDLAGPAGVDELEVGPGAEDRPVGGQHADPDVVVGLGLLEVGLHRLGHDVVDGVAGLGAVEGEEGDVAPDFVFDHGGDLSQRGAPGRQGPVATTLGLDHRCAQSSHEPAESHLSCPFCAAYEVQRLYLGTRHLDSCQCRFVRRPVGSGPPRAAPTGAGLALPVVTVGRLDRGLRSRRHVHRLRRGPRGAVPGPGRARSQVGRGRPLMRSAPTTASPSPTTWRSTTPRRCSRSRASPRSWPDSAVGRWLEQAPGAGSELARFGWHPAVALFTDAFDGPKTLGPCSTSSAWRPPTSFPRRQPHDRACALEAGAVSPSPDGTLWRRPRTATWSSRSRAAAGLLGVVGAVRPRAVPRARAQLGAASSIAAVADSAGGASQQRAAPRHRARRPPRHRWAARLRRVAGRELGGRLGGGRCLRPTPPGGGGGSFPPPGLPLPFGRPRPLDGAAGASMPNSAAIAGQAGGQLLERGEQLVARLGRDPLRGDLAPDGGVGERVEHRGVAVGAGLGGEGLGGLLGEAGGQLRWERRTGLGGRELTRRARTTRPAAMVSSISASHAVCSASTRAARPVRSFSASSRVSSSRAATSAATTTERRSRRSSSAISASAASALSLPLGGAQGGHDLLGEGHAGGRR